MVDDDDLTLVPDGVHDRACFVFSGTTFNVAVQWRFSPSGRRNPFGQLGFIGSNDDQGGLSGRADEMDGAPCGRATR